MARGRKGTTSWWSDSDGLGVNQPMRGKHMFKIAGTREFDIAPSLVYANTIVTVEGAMGGKSARTKVISGDLSVDKADELFCGSR